jgi:hypothetical protein
MLSSTFTIGAMVSSALLAHASPANFTERRAPLAQVITACTVPHTAALTFDDGPYKYIQVLCLYPSWVIPSFLTYSTPGI